MKIIYKVYIQMKGKSSTRNAKRASSTKRSKRTRKHTLRGGFRYGNKTKHTPIPGEVLISAPKTITRSRSRNKSRTSRNKFSSWF